MQILKKGFMGLAVAALVLAATSSQALNEKLFQETWDTATPAQTRLVTPAVGGIPGVGTIAAPSQVGHTQWTYSIGTGCGTWLIDTRTIFTTPLVGRAFGNISNGGQDTGTCDAILSSTVDPIAKKVSMRATFKINATDSVANRRIIFALMNSGDTYSVGGNRYEIRWMGSSTATDPLQVYVYNSGGNSNNNGAIRAVLPVGSIAGLPTLGTSQFVMQADLIRVSDASTAVNLSVIQWDKATPGTTTTLCNVAFNIGRGLDSLDSLGAPLRLDKVHLDFQRRPRTYVDDLQVFVDDLPKLSVTPADNVMRYLLASAGGGTQTRTATFTNSGLMPLAITSLALFGDVTSSSINKAMFTMSPSPAPITLPPGASTSVNVTFTDTLTGPVPEDVPASDVIKIVSNNLGTPGTINYVTLWGYRPDPFTRNYVTLTTADWDDTTGGGVGAWSPQSTPKSEDTCAIGGGVTNRTRSLTIDPNYIGGNLSAVKSLAFSGGSAELHMLIPGTTTACDFNIAGTGTVVFTQPGATSWIECYNLNLSNEGQPAYGVGNGTYNLNGGQLTSLGGTFRIGRYGPGVLNMASGTLINSTSSLTFELGSSPNGVGTMDVNTAAVTLPGIAADVLNVGLAGKGTMTIRNTSNVTLGVGSNMVRIASASGSVGFLTITASNLIANGTGNFNAGVNGLARTVVNSGGVIQHNATNADFSIGNGTGGYNARVTINSGGSITKTGTAGMVTIANSSFGDGAMIINAGGTFTKNGIAPDFAGDTRIGNDANSSGSLVVDGAGAKYIHISGTNLPNADNDLIVGYNGRGTLTVSNGGVTSISGGLIVGRSNSLLGDNIATISGATSRIYTWNRNLSIGNNSGATYGAGGKGTLNILGGKILTSASSGAGDVIIASGTGSTGIVNISGGSLIHRGTGDFRVGSNPFSNGVINMSSGEVRTSYSVQLGYNPGANGRVVMDGGLIMTGDTRTSRFVVGRAGRGVLIMNNGRIIVPDTGGYLTASRETDGGSSGTIIINGGTVDVANDVRVGYGSTGTWGQNINGFLTINGGTVRTNLLTFNYDGTSSATMNMMSGSLKVSQQIRHRSPAGVIQGLSWTGGGIAVGGGLANPTTVSLPLTLNNSGTGTLYVGGQGTIGQTLFAPDAALAVGYAQGASAKANFDINGTALTNDLLTMAADVSTTLSGQVQLNLLAPVIPDVNRTFTLAQTSGAGIIDHPGLSLAPVAGAITPGEWTLGYPNVRTLEVTYHKRPLIEIDPTSVTCAVNRVFETEATMFLNINNLGDQDLIISSLTFSDATPGRFTINPPLTLPLTIPGLGTQVVGVRFVPPSLALAVYPNTLTVGSNDPITPSAVANAVGQVYEMPNDVPTLAITAPLNIVRGGSLVGPTTVGTIRDDQLLSLLTVVLGAAPANVSPFTPTLVPVANPKNGVVKMTAQAALAATPAAYPVSIKIIDPFNLSVSDVLTVNVLANAAPVLVYPSGVAVVVFPGNTAGSDASPLTFTDDDAVLPTAFSVVSQAPASPAFDTLTVDSSGNVHLVALAGMTEGPYTITIRVTDAAANNTDATFVARVSGATTPGLDVKTWMRY